MFEKLNVGGDVELTHLAIRYKMIAHSYFILLTAIKAIIIIIYYLAFSFADSMSPIVTFGSH